MKTLDYNVHGRILAEVAILGKMLCGNFTLQMEYGGKYRLFDSMDVERLVLVDTGGNKECTLSLYLRWKSR